MSNETILAVIMAEKCQGILRGRASALVDPPACLQPEHLTWMCAEIIRHADDWPATRSHRWLGFVQAAMIAGGMLRYSEAKAMFDLAQGPEATVDQDLLDHLDPSNSFRFELGGQG